MTEAPVIYAIGDIHGRDDLLERLLGQIRANANRRYPDRPRRIVYLGDYVDRGPDSAGVIDRVMAGVPGFDSICLKGNHEEMMLSCLETGRLWETELWLANGGDRTLESYGLVDPDTHHDVEAMRAVVGERHWNWLKSLKLSYQQDGYFFVHAGIVPGRPIDEQEEKDLLWIRSAFLDSRADHGVRVVHGHTPADAPEVRPNRINLDTGAVFTGHLTCAVLDGTEGEGAPRFLVT